MSPYRKSIPGLAGGAADPRIGRMATDLVRRWKEAAAAAAAIPGGDNDSATTSSGSGSSSGANNGSVRGGGGGKVGGAKGDGGCAVAAAAAGGAQRCSTPAEDKQRMVEEGFRCRTWESLYQVLRSINMYRR